MYNEDAFGRRFVAHLMHFLVIILQISHLVACIYGKTQITRKQFEFCINNIFGQFWNYIFAPLARISFTTA